jgi:hypothetical protein
MVQVGSGECPWPSARAAALNTSTSSEIWSAGSGLEHPAYLGKDAGIEVLATVGFLSVRIPGKTISV